MADMDSLRSPEPFGTWIAKRATVALVLFLAWSWFVSSPGGISSALDKTGAAWCAVAPCPSETENVQADTSKLLPDPAGVWAGLDNLRSGGDELRESWGLEPDDDRSGEEVES
ncbi:MAG: hypothetical protein AAGA59_08245 [Actinomycetota bacterium]